VIGTGGADSYVSNVTLSSNDLTFTGVGSAFNSTVGNVANIGISNTFTGELNLFSSVGGEVYAKSTSATSGGAGFMVTNEASANRFQFGYNNNSNEAFIMATQDEPIKILTNSSEQYRFDGETFWIKDVGTTPTTPNSTFGGFYTKGDKPYFISDGGTEYDLSATGGGSLWTEDTNGITYASGNVGINAASSAIYDLNVVGANTTTGFFQNTNTGSAIEAIRGHTTAGGLASSAVTGVNSSTTTSEHFGGIFSATAGTNGIGVEGQGGEADFRANDSGTYESKEQASTATPQSGYGSFYFKTDGKAYAKNDAGTEYDLTQSGGTSPWTDGGTFLYPTNDEDIQLSHTDAPQILMRDESYPSAYYSFGANTGGNSSWNYSTAGVTYNSGLSLAATDGDMRLFNRLRIGDGFPVSHKLEVDGAMKAKTQKNTVLNGSKTANFSHDSENGDIGAYRVNLAALTLSIHNLESGDQGTIFLDYHTTTPTSLTVNTYSDAGTTGLTEVPLGSAASPAINKMTSVTYTCANDGTNTYVTLVYGQEQ
jgi:hypothetical protein